MTKLSTTQEVSDWLEPIAMSCARRAVERVRCLATELAQDAQHCAAAARVAPYDDDAMVAELTAETIAAGHRIFQAHMLGADDREHCAKLLEMMAPRRDALVLDAGCGIGEVARLMRELRRDLFFWMLSISPAQLKQCPMQFLSSEGDLAELPFKAAEFDAVMALYSLGHAPLDRALLEAARVLKPGGVLFVYDLATDDPTRLINDLGYVARPRWLVEDAAKCAGFRVDRVWTDLATDTTAFQALYGAEAFARTFAGVAPIAYRFVKETVA